MKNFAFSMILGATAALLGGCGTDDDKDKASPTNGGSGSAGSGGSSAGNSSAGSGGDTSGGTGGSSAGSGAVQSNGPPCDTNLGPNLDERADVEQLRVSPGVSSIFDLVVDSHGVFWVEGQDVLRMPLAGGEPVVVATGDYEPFRTSATDLYLLGTRNTGALLPIALSVVPADASAATPTELLTVAEGEQVVELDDEYLYVFADTTQKIERAALADGSRTVVAEGVAYFIDGQLYGDHLYYQDDMQHIMRVPKAGGTPEQVLYEFDMWMFDIAENTVLIGGFQEVMTTPLDTPGQPTRVLTISDGFVDRMTITNGKIFYENWDQAIGWVNLEGTMCEGLFVPSSFFTTAKVFDGYAYVAGSGAGADATIKRVPLP